MKKVLVALAVVVGLGSSVAFAHVTSEVQSVIQALQDPQDEFTKIEVKDLPQAVVNTLAKDYERATIIRKSKFPQNPKRSVRFSGKGTKRSVQKKESTQHSKSRNKRFVMTSVSAL